MMTFILSLALVIIGLVILIAALMLVHPAFRDAGIKSLREWIQASAHFDVGKEGIRREAEQRKQREQQQQPPAKSQGDATTQRVAAPRAQHFSHQLCPHCESLVPTGASFCFHCGAVLDTSAVEKPPPLDLKETPTPSAGRPPVARAVPSSVPMTLQPSPAATTRDTQAVQLPGGGTGGELAEAQRIVSSAQAQPPAACRLNMTVDSFTHPGIKRQHKPNEDSIFVAQGTRLHSPQPQQSQFVSLLIVADGMGGHLFGLEASRLSIQTMIDWILPKLCGQHGLSKADCRQLLVSGVQAANQTIYQQNKANSTEMGTTVTAALIVDEIVFVANVGDSRTYLYREAEGLRKITIDHSVVAYLVENGIIKPDDIYIHPQRSQLYRSLGVEGKVHVDLFTEQLQPGDTLLLCSDGLWEMVRDPGIQHILQHESAPAQIRQALFHAALEGGGADNISIIVAHMTHMTHMTRTAGPATGTGIQLLVKPETVVMPNMSPDEPQPLSQ